MSLDITVRGNGRFLGPPTREQLDRFFWLNDTDQARPSGRPGLLPGCPNPSILPGNYAAGLVTVLGLVWAAAAIVLVVRLHRRRAG